MNAAHNHIGTTGMTEEGDLVMAIPPEDYTGSVGKWMQELQIRGYWDGDGWHGDVMIPRDVWWEILEKLEPPKPKIRFIDHPTMLTIEGEPNFNVSVVKERMKSLFDELRPIMTVNKHFHIPVRENGVPTGKLLRVKEGSKLHEQLLETCKGKMPAWIENNPKYEFRNNRQDSQQPGNTSPGEEVDDSERDS